MAVNPVCPICGKDIDTSENRYLMPQYDTSLKPLVDKFGAQLTARVDENVKIFMHNPNRMQEDIEVTAHQLCVNKVKTVLPDFDKPIESVKTYPVLDKDLKVVIAAKPMLVKQAVVEEPIEEVK